MKVNTFSTAPKHLFRAKLLAPLAGVFFVGVVAMGILADPKGMFTPQPVKSSQYPTTGLPLFLQDASRGGVKHWRTVLYFSTHVPEVCWGDNALNDFQKRQCSEFWDHLGMGWLLGFLPLGLCLLIYHLAMQSLNTVYRKGHRRIQKGQPMGTGTVTNPASAPADWFSRIYCMRPIGVEVGKNKQIKVYIPLDAPLPMPGLKMAIFKPIDVLGQPRYFAVVYAPHVAVVSGIRHR